MTINDMLLYRKVSYCGSLFIVLADIPVTFYCTAQYSTHITSGLVWHSSPILFD